FSFSITYYLLFFLLLFFFFFFQAEDGRRDRNVTGVQTCALPIYRYRLVGCGAPEPRQAGPCPCRGRTRRSWRVLDRHRRPRCGIVRRAGQTRGAGDNLRPVDGRARPEHGTDRRPRHETSPTQPSSADGRQPVDIAVPVSTRSGMLVRDRQPDTASRLPAG